MTLRRLTARQEATRFRGSGGVWLRPLGAGVEFLIVTRRDSMDAIARFAGMDPEAAVVPDKVAEMMIDYDRRRWA